MINSFYVIENMKVSKFTFFNCIFSIRFYFAKLSLFFYRNITIFLFPVNMETLYNFLYLLHKSYPL